jgi:hypothetical protein
MPRASNGAHKNAAEITPAAGGLMQPHCFVERWRPHTASYAKTRDKFKLYFSARKRC